MPQAVKLPHLTLSSSAPTVYLQTFPPNAHPENLYPFCFSSLHAIVSKVWSKRDPLPHLENCMCCTMAETFYLEKKNVQCVCLGENKQGEARVFEMGYYYE